MSNQKIIPQYIQESIDRYVNFGHNPGSFLKAVLENDLRESINRSSNESLEYLPNIVLYCYHHIPMQCWGNKSMVENWIQKKSKQNIKSV